MEESRGPSPPPAMAVNLSNKTAQQLDELLQVSLDTDQMYADSTILFAIEQNKSQQMIGEHQNLINELGLERDPDTKALDESEFYSILGEVYPEEIGMYEHKVLGWKRKNFQRTRMMVKYGNCPQCFRAYPKGHTCLKCHNEVAKTLYFVLERPHIPPYFDHANGPVGIAAGMHCEPLEVADLVGLKEETPIMLDHCRLVSTVDGYRPNDKSLYEFITLQYLMNSMGHYVQSKGDEIESYLKGSTNASNDEVRAAVDQYYETKVDSVKYGAILLRRGGAYTPEQQIALQAYQDWANQPDPYQPW
jgi:hypothetical protein